jgi:hypothetical protein
MWYHRSIFIVATLILFFERLISHIFHVFIV